MEAVCWVLATLLVLTFFGARTWGELERERTVPAFSQAQLEALPADPRPVKPQWSAAAPLHETTAPSITLVTCYPFYFVGESPQQCIARAVTVEF